MHAFSLVLLPVLGGFANMLRGGYPPTGHTQLARFLFALILATATQLAVGVGGVLTLLALLEGTLAGSPSDHAAALAAALPVLLPPPLVLAGFFAGCFIGHTPFVWMGRAEDSPEPPGTRKEWLAELVALLFKKQSAAFCWLGMGLTGLWNVGFAALGLGLLGYAVWPLLVVGAAKGAAYDFGQRMPTRRVLGILRRTGTEWAEPCFGVMLGLALVLTFTLS